MSFVDFWTQGSIYQSVRYVAIGLQGPEVPAAAIGVTIYGGFAMVARRGGGRICSAPTGSGHGGLKHMPAW